MGWDNVKGKLSRREIWRHLFSFVFLAIIEEFKPAVPNLGYAYLKGYEKDSRRYVKCKALVTIRKITWLKIRVFVSL